MPCSLTVIHAIRPGSGQCHQFNIREANRMILAQYVSVIIPWPIIVALALCWAAAIVAYVFLIRRWRFLAWIGLVLGVLSLGVSVIHVMPGIERLRTVPPSAGNYEGYRKNEIPIIRQDFLNASPFYVPAILCSLYGLLRRPSGSRCGPKHE